MPPAPDAAFCSSGRLASAEGKGGQDLLRVGAAEGDAGLGQGAGAAVVGKGGEAEDHGLVHQRLGEPGVVVGKL